MINVVHIDSRVEREHFRRNDVIASSSPYRISYARLAPSLINNEREVDESMRVLRAMAT